MEQQPIPQTQTQPSTQPPPPIPPTPTYPDSLDSSPRSRNTDSWDETTTITTTTTTFNPQPKLRLMCSYGGHIVPRPHDKSLCYIGGDTRIVVVDRHTSLVDLTSRLTKTLIKSQSSSSLSSQQNTQFLQPFTLKYQLPSEDLDSLISVTTDEDLENMIDEYERLNADVTKSSRLRLFLFPNKPESVTSIGSLLENSTKSEDWFLNALNGTTSGFSDTSSVNCLLGLDDDVLGGSSLQPNDGGGGQDVHSVPDLERSSSFGSASSSPSLASLPPIRVHVEDGVKVVEEQFGNMNVNNPPVVVTGVPIVGNVEYGNRVLSEDERSDQGSQHGYQKVVPVQVQQMQSQQQQYQQKPSMGFDLASPDSVSSDGSRQKPTMIYQDPLVQIQSSNNVNRTGELSSNNSNVSDQSVRIQMQQQQQQQQQQIADSAYLMSMSNTQVDPQHTQMHHQQQPQFIHTAVPQPQYIQHHPSGAVPMASYYQMYPSQNQHHPHHPALDQQNFVYYMPAPVRQAPQGYNMPMQQQGTGYAEVSSGASTPLAHSQVPPSGYTTARTTQTVQKSELPAGVYGTTNSGGSQYVQVPSSQHQVQPQYVGYSQMHHPSQSVASSASSAGGNYGYEFADPAQGQHVYYAAQPLPPQSNAQYQNVAGESGSYLPSDNSTKQQQGRTQQS
nr:hypothetical protein [Tanacetum cinerariifolium]